MSVAMTDRLCAVTLDDNGLPAPTPEMMQERQVAIFDLLEENSFALPNVDTSGPFALTLSARDRRLTFDLRTESGAPVTDFYLSLTPFRQIIKDYFEICESYFDAVKRLGPAQIEAIDEGRRGIHDEGARVLQERLDGKATIDMATSRRLFTLVSVLHSR